jgi:hypothetical protein
MTYRKTLLWLLLAASAHLLWPRVVCGPNEKEGTRGRGDIEIEDPLGYRIRFDSAVSPHPVHRVVIKDRLDDLFALETFRPTSVIVGSTSFDVSDFQALAASDESGRLRYDRILRLRDSWAHLEIELDSSTREARWSLSLDGDLDREPSQAPQRNGELCSLWFTAVTGAVGFEIRADKGRVLELAMAAPEEERPKGKSLRPGRSRRAGSTGLPAEPARPQPEIDLEGAETQTRAAEEWKFAEVDLEDPLPRDRDTEPEKVRFVPIANIGTIHFDNLPEIRTNEVKSRVQVHPTKKQKPAGAPPGD